MDEEEKNFSTWTNPLNSPVVNESNLQSEFPDKKPSFKDRLRLFIKRPWIRSLLISLMIVMVGIGGSYAAYYKQKKKAEKTFADQVTIVSTPSVDSDTLTPSGSQDNPSGQSNSGSNQGSSSSNSSSAPSNTSNSSGTSNNSSNSSSGSSSTATKTINDVATEMILKTSPNSKCSALAPNDWAIVANDYGMDAGLSDPGLTTFASWSVPWSLNSMLAWSGHPELAQEENFLKVSLCTANFADRYGVASLDLCGNGGDYQNVSLGSASSLPNGYYSRDYSLTNNAMKKSLRGQVIYKNFSSGDVILYLLRMGSTITSDWDSKGALAVSSAISIRCTVNSTGSALGSGVDRSSSDSDITLSDKWEEAIMGYENVYNPSTGQHWEAPSSSYWDTGPQGAGYYYQNGNDLTKLSRGFGI